MNKDLPTPEPASATFNVFCGNPPFVILLKNSKSKGILSSTL